MRQYVKYSIGEKVYFDNYNNKFHNGKYDDWFKEFYNEVQGACEKLDY